MAGAIAKLYATLGLDTRGFDKGLTQTQSKTQSFVSNFKQQAMAGFGIGAGMGAFGLVTRGVGAAVDVIGDAISAAMEEEAAIATLTRSIEANDKAWDGNVDAVEEVIRAREGLAFADDEQRASLQRLVSVTKDVDKALELQATAMDLARLRGMDLATAGDLIGKVYSGNLGTLSRYGIVLEKGTTATEALAEIQRRASGQAEAYADTAQGRMISAQIKMNDAMEDFGATLIPIVNELLPHLTNAIDLVADAFAQPSLQSQSFAAWADGLDGVVKGADALAGAAEDVGSGLGTFEDIWADTPLGLLAPGFSEAVKLWREYGSELGKVGLSFQDFKGGLNTIKMEMGVTTDEAVDMIRQWAAMDDATTQASAAVDAMAGNIRSALDGLFGVSVAPPDIAGPIEDEMAAARDAIRSGMGSIKELLKEKPKFISREDRIANLQQRQGRVEGRLQRAVRAEDPFAIREYAKAAAKNKLQLQEMRSGTNMSLKDVKSKYRDAGIDIGATWDRTQRVISRESKTAADAAISEAQRTASTMAALDFASIGSNWMLSLAAGITANIGAVSSAAAAAATAAQAASAGAKAAASVAPRPDAGGTTVMVSGNVYGGPAGLDQLGREIDRRKNARSRGPMRYQQQD